MNQQNKLQKSLSRQLIDAASNEPDFINCGYEAMKKYIEEIHEELQQKLVEANQRADKSVAGMNLQESQLYRLKEKLAAEKERADVYQAVVKEAKKSVHYYNGNCYCEGCEAIRSLPIPESEDRDE